MHSDTLLCLSIPADRRVNYSLSSILYGTDILSILYPATDYYGLCSTGWIMMEHIIYQRAENDVP